MRYKLIIFDIDGTVARHKNSWKLIHERRGLWDRRAYVYQKKFLAGKISYREFCESDARLWRGMPEKIIKDIFKAAPYSKNVRRYIPLLKKKKFKLAAISTGLQYMAGRVKKELKFDYVISNELVSKGGVLTGKVRINVGHAAKGAAVERALKRFRVKKNAVISVGDSIGDMPLARNSGYSIAFNSSDKAYSEIVDYNCKTKDFREVYEKIIDRQYLASRGR